MEYKQITSFSGINRGVSPFNIAEGELADTQNFHTKKIGILKKTGDYELLYAQITASQVIYGGIDHMVADGTHLHIVAINGSSNAKIYADQTFGVSTSSSQSLSLSKSPSSSQSPSASISASTSASPS